MAAETLGATSFSSIRLSFCYYFFFFFKPFKNRQIILLSSVWGQILSADCSLLIPALYQIHQYFCYKQEYKTWKKLTSLPSALQSKTMLWSSAKNIISKCSLLVPKQECLTSQMGSDSLYWHCLLCLRDKNSEIKVKQTVLITRGQ
jgi:hypothetical protein